MRVAALYDIHGNLPALEAVLRDVDAAAVDLVVVGGDVLPGPMPNETLELLLELKTSVAFIHGNGESAVLAELSGKPNAKLPEQAREAIRWNAQQLSSDHRHLIASWPATFRIELRGVANVLFCHATSRNDYEIFLPSTPEQTVLPIFRDLGVAVVVCGHIHVQFDRMIGNTRVINAGSVGMPFGKPGADWLLLGPDVQLRHTDYDLQHAAGRIRETHYPSADEFASKYVLQPPTAEEMLKLLSGAELKN